VQGPWNIGRWSVLNGTISSIFLVGTSICFFFPTAFDENMNQTIDDFNWTIVVFGGALFVAGTYWFLPKSMGGARHFFTGPVRPEDVLEDFHEKKLAKIANKTPNAQNTAKISPVTEKINLKDLDEIEEIPQEPANSITLTGRR